MVSAIFGAVADFAESPEEKLDAVIRAGIIAEAFLSCASDESPPACARRKYISKK